MAGAAAANRTVGVGARPDSDLMAGAAAANRTVVVGAGPSGLAAAACLRELGVPVVVLERGNCIASLWQSATHGHGHLKVHLPKKFCELPLMGLPDQYPDNITRQQYTAYLEDYAAAFGIQPEFNTTVVSAKYDGCSGLWQVRATSPEAAEVLYECRCVVVATGRNGDPVVPDIPGLAGFVQAGRLVTHSSDYLSGEAFRGKRVLVVGCGNSGMEVAVDLHAHGARPAVVARSAVHVLPRDVLGKHVLEVAALLQRWLPSWAVDMVLGVVARAVHGDLAKVGLRLPSTGPLELREVRSHTTAVLDHRTVSLIRAVDITVVPAVARLDGVRGQAELVDGRYVDVDSVVLATGCRSNVPEATWHGEERLGYPATAFPDGWHGRCGLFAVGFSRRGFGGERAFAEDAARVADSIRRAWLQGSAPAGAHVDVLF